MAVLYAVLIFYFSSQSNLPEVARPIFAASDKVAHFLEFAFMGGLLFLTFANAGWRPWDAPLAIALGAIYGATDELHQVFIPGRTADTFDALFNALGAVAAVLILAYLDHRMHPTQVPARTGDA